MNHVIPKEATKLIGIKGTKEEYFKAVDELSDALRQLGKKKCQ